MRRSPRPGERPTRTHRRFVERMIRRRVSAWAVRHGLDQAAARDLARTYAGKSPRRGGSQADVRSNATTEQRLARQGMRRRDTAVLYASGMEATTNPAYAFLMQRR